MGNLIGAPALSASDFTDINGQASGQTINGTSGNDSLVGGTGDDTLNGFAGNDTLDGGAGADSMVGGTGDDVYFVDNVGDTIVEQANEGIDEVRASLDYTLPAFVNNLTLVASAYHGTGNDIENVITGSSIANILDGGAAADTLIGGGGADFLVGGAATDSFVFNVALGGSNNDEIGDFEVGLDKIHLDAGVMTALGTGGNFTANDPRFYAAAGASAGHDADDRVVYNTSTGQLWYDADGSGAGTALPIAVVLSGDTGSGGGSPAALTASDLFVDHGSVAPPPGINGTAGNDDMSGTSGNDLMNGLGGNDTMWAAAGNDTLNGGAGNDYLGGEAGQDWLYGAAGNDTLNGGGDRDHFVFADMGAANADHVTNFATAWDDLRFDSTAFTQLGAAGQFASGDARFFAAAGASGGHDADDRLIYDTSAGQLYYDADGSGAGAAQLVATLDGAPSLAATDITVI
jgi:Ca2+-binding RTX toxin-like protein